MREPLTLRSLIKGALSKCFSHTVAVPCICLILSYLNTILAMNGTAWTSSKEQLDGSMEGKVENLTMREPGTLMDEQSKDSPEEESKNSSKEDADLADFISHTSSSALTGIDVDPACTSACFTVPAAPLMERIIFILWSAALALVLLQLEHITYDRVWVGVVDNCHVDNF